MKQISNTLNCGDINLVAAMMSVGIPLDQTRPCSLVLTDKGQNYARYHVLSCSVDNTHQTERMFTFWKDPERCNDSDFKSIMDFVRHGRKLGASTADDWFDLAHTYLEGLESNPPHAPARINDIPDFIEKNQDGLAAHIYAFAYNREHAWKLLEQARRRVMISRGTSHAMIDTHLEKWQRNELLARLEG